MHHQQGTEHGGGWGEDVVLHPSQLSFLFRKSLLLLVFFINGNYEADIKIAI